MNEPISVQDALKLIELALADCNKATPEWGEGWLERRLNRPDAAFLVLARATMRPMLEYFKFGPWPRVEVHPTDSMHSFLAALRDHYSTVRPGWRER